MRLFAHQPPPSSGGGIARLPARRSSWMLLVGAVACLTVIGFQFSVFVNGEEMKKSAPKPGVALVSAAVSAVRSLLSMPSAPFSCEPIAQGSAAVLCESAHMRPAWSDVSEACTSKRLGNASSHTRLFVMRSAAWLSLRIEAYQKGFPDGGLMSSLLPINTTLEPWEVIRPIHDAAAMWEQRLLTAMSWQYEGRFDVMLNGTHVCKIARALQVRGPKGNALRASLAPSLIEPASQIVGVAVRGLNSSSFWELTWRRSMEVAGSISVSWCYKDMLAPSTRDMCSRTWVTPHALKQGMESAQFSLFTRNASMMLHDRAEAARMIPLSHARVADNKELLKGTQTDNHTLVNVAFNPPHSMSKAGRYLVAYDMVITPSGGLQSRASKAKAAAVSGGGGGGGGGGGHRFMHHTTCEPDKIDPYPEKYVGDLPVYNEVVVITHRLEYNIYHWTTESMGKMAAMLDYIAANPTVKIHVGIIANKKRQKDAKFRHEHMKILGLKWRTRVVQGYVRARVVHYVDNHMCGYPHGQWVILLRERYRAALGLDNPPLVLDRQPGQKMMIAAAPAATAKRKQALPVARKAASVDSNSNSSDVANITAALLEEAEGDVASASQQQQPPVKTIVVLRRGFSRRIENEEVLLKRMKKQLGAAVRIKEIRDWQMPSQAEVFRRLGTADAIIGPHGAGQTNAIVARPGTCLIEFIPTEWFVLCYWRMSGHLDLDYNMFVAPGDRYAPMTVSVSRAIGALKGCLGLSDSDGDSPAVAAASGMGGNHSSSSAGRRALSDAPPPSTAKATSSSSSAVGKEAATKDGGKLQLRGGGASDGGKKPPQLQQQESKSGTNGNNGGDSAGGKGGSPKGSQNQHQGAPRSQHHSSGSSSTSGASGGSKDMQIRENKLLEVRGSLGDELEPAGELAGADLGPRTVPNAQPAALQQQQPAAPAKDAAPAAANPASLPAKPAVGGAAAAAAGNKR